MPAGTYSGSDFVHGVKLGDRGWGLISMRVSSGSSSSSHVGFCICVA